MTRRLYIVGFLLLYVTTGCHSRRGVGKYLLSSEGRYPKTDAVYEIDTALNKIKAFCNDLPESQSQCTSAATSAYPSETSVFLVSNQESATLFKSSFRISSNNIVLSTFPTNESCPDCNVVDFSVLPDASGLVASFFSKTLKSSSIWTFSLRNHRWSKVTEWCHLPDWLTRPYLSGSDKLFFLQLTRHGGMLSSNLLRLSAGKIDDISQKKQIAAYALGPADDIVMWTEKGLEIKSPFRNRILAPKSILERTDTLRSGGLVWNEKEGVIALGVFNKATNLTRIIEVNIQNGFAQTVFEKRIGGEVSLQLLER